MAPTPPAEEVAAAENSDGDDTAETENIDEAVQRVFQGRLDHIIHLIQTNNQHAFALQGLKFGCKNTVRNLKWLLVGWDAGSGSLLFPCCVMPPAVSGVSGGSVALL